MSQRPFSESSPRARFIVSLMSARVLQLIGVVLSLTLVSSALHAAPAGVNDYPMSPHQVAEGVYAVVTPTRELPNPDNKGWNSNSAFVVTGDGVLVFDTGSSEVIGQALRRTIREVTDQPVRWVVVSHGHGDHWLGNAAFAAPGVEIIASPQVAEHMRTDGERWVGEFDRMTQGATGTSRIVPASTIVDARTRQVLGDTEVVILPSGGAHSPGDLLVWLPERRVLLAGDVIYSERMPSTFAADLRQWIAVLEDIQAFEPTPDVVVAGHGGVTDMAGVRRLHSLLSDLWTAVQTGYDSGKADFEMVPDVRRALAEYRDDYPGLDEKLQRDIGHVYLQVEAAAFE